ncbi:Hypothetical Protein SiL_0857 [Sulfolobus islandicus LAL14/1]|uniref:Uncharacterized protein n=1 Tax=Saccharolobus islandicus LAL14/1 TaxID=1241935 RepID=M9UCP5_SACIS|nr:Hypothetical Protein SiL_0857 [Sulfolobus islandicus LAL14/1]
MSTFCNKLKKLLSDELLSTKIMDKPEFLSIWIILNSISVSGLYVTMHTEIDKLSNDKTY